MTQSELSAELLKGNLDMLKGTVADFSDADFLARPCPGANHAAWQLGHLTNSERHMLAASNVAGAPAARPGYEEKFKKETASVDDPSFFPKKAELLDAFSAVRAATIAWVKTLNAADLERPAPEKMRAWAPTVGHLVAMIPAHTMMHVGQFQVIRRKLGKPVLF